MSTWLRTLLEDIATAPSMDTKIRHDLLVDVLAPLGPVDANTYASAIEEPAYWVRVGTYASGEDLQFGNALDLAVFQVEQVFGLAAA